MRLHSLLLIASAVGVTHCAQEPVESPPTAPSIDFEYVPPQPPKGIATRLDGREVMVMLPGLGFQLVHDPELRGPAYAAGRCADWVIQCVEKASETIERCVAAAPVCATDTAWDEATACCPRECQSRFEALTAPDGLAAYEALPQALFKERLCGLAPLGGSQ